MAEKKQAVHQKDDCAIHQYYMDIIYYMPNIVYWVDIDCNLKGCNNNFVQLLGLKSISDFIGTPYAQMAKFTAWSSERIELFKLDDMAVIFSGEPTFDVEETPVYGKDDEVTYYVATRVPLFDKDKKAIGLVVILSDVSSQKKEMQPIAPMDGKKVNRDPNYIPRVLMVEDNFIAQKVEGALLKSLNCQVDIAESGDMALKLFASGKYDIVFMDIGLQDTSGYMVAKKFRQMEKNTEHHVPIIALTSYQADVVKNDVNDYFMEGVVTKPLTIEQARQIIQHYVFYENIAVDGLKKS